MSFKLMAVYPDGHYERTTTHPRLMTQDSVYLQYYAREDVFWRISIENL